jgi:hypothetical protein
MAATPGKFVDYQFKRRQFDGAREMGEQFLFRQLGSTAAAA